MSIAGKKIGVALSGGGYRVVAYHIGTLRALHHLGLLDNVDVLFSVSGGSITAAYYALHKDDYEDFEQSFIKGLSRGVLWSSFLYLGGVGLVLLRSLWRWATWRPSSRGSSSSISPYSRGYVQRWAV